MTPKGRGPNFPAEDDYDLCDHGLPLEDFCEACEGGESDLFDADELGLNPEDDDSRARGGSDA